MQGDQVFEDEDEDFSDETNGDGHQSQRVMTNQQVEDDGMEAGDEDDEEWEDEEKSKQQRSQENQWRIQPNHRPLSPRQQASLYEQQQQQQRSLSPIDTDNTSAQRTITPQDQYQNNQLQRQHEQQQLLQQQHQQRTVSAGAGQYASQQQQQQQLALRQQNNDSSRRNTFEGDAPTKKLSASPPIVRDPNFDINNPFADLPGGVPRSISPTRVRGVEVVDPNDPRYRQLITDRRQSETKSESDRSPPLGSNEQSNTTLTRKGSGSSFTNGFSKKAKKEDAAEANGEKKKKTGILSGLFRKKDKKDKKKEKSGSNMDDFKENDSRGSIEASSDEPHGRRESQTAESMFSTDAALRQQQVEAKQAMFNQYGVQREPGEVSNTMIPRSAISQQQNTSLSPLMASGSPVARRMRPGSLIGSPGLTGAEVPLLSVLRVFAGDNIESDATFKTTLLNRSTSSSELVKQSMQRFRLNGSEDREEYYLTVRELGGEERPLSDEEKPLIIYQSLADESAIVPSVKRSSVGSMDSVASGLSLNPAITRLGMNDFTDDSAVKFYLNRRTQLNPILTLPTPPSSNVDHTVSTAPVMTRQSSDTIPGASFRFAIRLLIYEEDLPENVVFDPQSNAIIPRNVLDERQVRSSIVPAPTPSSTSAREKIIFFPRNANVSEVIEAGLDRFGIVDGVVDGGDEVEDRISNRRSVPRVKYGLALRVDGKGMISSGPRLNRELIVL